MLRAAATPQQAPGLGNSLVRFTLAQVSHSLGQVYCLANTPGAGTPNVDAKCAIEADLSVYLEGNIALNTTLARVQGVMTGQQSAITADEAPINTTLADAQQTQAPAAILSSLKTISAQAQTLLVDANQAVDVAAKYVSAQKSSLINATDLSEGAVDAILALAEMMNPTDASKNKDIISQMLGQLTKNENQTATDSGATCSDATDYACMLERLLGTDFLFDTIVIKQFSTNVQRVSADIANLNPNQYDALVKASHQMANEQTSFDAIDSSIGDTMNSETHQFSLVSKVMKTKHDTVKNSISNIR